MNYELKLTMHMKYTILIVAALSIFISDCTAQKNKSKSSNTKAITKVDLPEPYATPDTKKNSKVIGWPEGKTPIAPEGFVVTKYADKSNKLNNPRWIYVTPNGDILISQSKTNKKTSPNNIII